MFFEKIYNVNKTKKFSNELLKFSNYKYRDFYYDLFHQNKVYADVLVKNHVLTGSSIKKFFSSETLTNKYDFADDTFINIMFRKIDDTSNLWIWVEFKDYLLEIDKENFEDVITAFFIVGKLGAFNSLNLQTFFAGEIELSFFN
jgi:hypothetical protein